jgi:hypothetical protein
MFYGVQRETRGDHVIQTADVQQLMNHWWFAYDNALFEEWRGLWASDAHFSCRSDTGRTAFEEFVTADAHGLDAVMAWQTDHRLHSPHPLRHGAENVHILAVTDTSADFRSYIRVSQIVDGKVSHLSTAIVHGAVAIEDGELKIADLNVVLDTEESTPLAEKQAAQG